MNILKSWFSGLENLRKLIIFESHENLFHINHFSYHYKTFVCGKFLFVSAVAIFDAKQESKVLEISWKFVVQKV